MKKLSFLALILMFSVVWNAAQAIVTFDKANPLVTSVDQLSANSIQPGDGGGLAALIDGNLGTHFHSQYNDNETPRPDAEHYLQVDLSSSPVDAIIFTLNGRSGGYHDTPDDVSVLVTNTPDDEDSWVEATRLDDMIEGNPADVYYVSPAIDLKGTYSYVRFVVHSCTQGRTTEVNGNTYYFWNATEFQVYKAVDVNAAIYAAWTYEDQADNYSVDGTDPGYYSADAKYAFEVALDSARTEGAVEGITEAKAEALAKAVTDALEALQNSRIQVSDGYYSFINAFATFEANQGVKKALGATESNLVWGSFDPDDAGFLFEVKKLDDGSFSVKNVKTAKYSNTVAGYSQVVPVSAEQETGQVFISLGTTPQFNLANTANTDYPYHPAGHSGGSGVSGNIVGWAGGAGTQSAWFVQKVTDEAKIAALIAQGENYRTSAELSDLLTKAWAVDNAARTALITSDAQFSSNAKEPNEGSFANLIDNNTGTFFHTMWSQAGPEGPHNLQVDLKNAVAKFNYTFTARGSGNHDTPKKFNILGTNDAALAADATSADADWTLVKEVDENTIPNVNAYVYGDNVEADQAYRYYRIVVINTTDQNAGRVNSQSGQPYFNLSEFQVYAADDASIYAASADAKTAIDALDATIASAVQKLKDAAVTAADVEALAAAVEAAEKAVNPIVENRKRAGELAEAIAAADEIRDLAFDLGALITSGSQIASNAQSTGDGSAYANLIDNNTGTIFHSVWDGAYGDDANPPTTGTGYHNLQFTLNDAVSKFYFSYIGRVGSDWHDSPDNIGVYVTNDAALGASTDNAETSAWVHIADLTEGFPGDVEGAEYTSPMLNLGDAYKYIRLVVRHATHTEVVDSRHFSAPEISGVTFNLSEIQLYGGEATASSEYNTVEGMKAAVDELDAKIAAAKANLAAGTLTDDDIAAIKAAAEEIQNLYVDRDAVNAEVATLAAQAAAAQAEAIGEMPALIKNASQLSANSISYADAGATALANLIDGNTESVFHSVWHEEMRNADVTAESWAATLAGLGDSYYTEGIGFHNLQVKFDEAVSKFNFAYTGRNSSDWCDSPNDIIIYGTNDDDLGGRTLASESASWTELARLNEGFPTKGALVKYASPSIDLGGAYKYVRFEFRNTNNFNLMDARTFTKPEITGITWDLSEFQIYNTSNSDYENDEDLKAAVDAMTELASAVTAKAAARTALPADAEALKAAVENVQALLEAGKAAKEEIAAEIAETLKSANAAIAAASAALITDESQFRSNAQSNGDDSSFAHLLDDDLHYTHNFHTIWNGDHMQNDNETVEDWNAFTTEYYGGKEVGTGYHHLQVALEEPVQTIQFSYVSRTGTAFTDNPNDVEIYVTNDATLGAGVNNADLDKWTRVTEISEGFVADGQGLEYVSPEIDFGAAYKYIRFLVKGTTHQGTVAARTFKHPEITGVTFNISKFQVYSKTEESDYAESANVKAAVDELTELVEAANAKIANLTVTKADLDALQAAIANVQKEKDIYSNLKPLKDELAQAIVEAEEARNQTYEFAELVTDAGQISTNSHSSGDSNEEGYSHLIDNNTNTVFHSVWDGAFGDDNNPPTTGTGYHNVQFKLNDGVDRLYFTYVGRGGTAWHDSPDDIDIYVTNDDELGASTDAADSEKWIYAKNLHKGFPEDVEYATYKSPIVYFNGNYKYVRFVFKHTTHTEVVDSRHFSAPEVSGVTWNLSELHLFGGEPLANSQYYTVDGLKDLVDQIDGKIIECLNKLGEANLTQADIDALKELTAQIKANSVNYDETSAELAALVAKANEVYALETGEKVALITNAAQLSANSISYADAGTAALANLIDGNTGSIFHSIWDGEMGNDNVTAESWANTLANLDANSYVKNGIGYHNLQVAFDNPVSKFVLAYTGRDSGDWCDSPNDIVVFGTNDDKLGSSTLASESASWTELARLNEGFPSKGALVTYESPVVDLNGTYKYIRFEFRNTNNFNLMDARTFKKPEITGVTWDLSEFQLYYEGDAEKYNGDEAFKADVDAMKVLADEYANVARTDATPDKVETLAAAIKKVLNGYNAELASLVEEAKATRALANDNDELVTDESQISSNAQSTGDGSAYANLIDNNTSTIFHSVWDGAYGDDANPPSEGTGYHNLQFTLNKAVDKFFFNYIGRVGSDWHDSPNNIGVYVTNDDALGANTAAADSTLWVHVTDLVDGFPGDVEGAQYTSPVLELDDAYKYVRLVVRHATHTEVVDSRHFSAPAVSGVTFNVSELHVLDAAANAQSEYYHVPGMKGACDLLDELIEAAEEKIAGGVATSADIESLKGAIATVKALYVDRDAIDAQLASLIEKANDAYEKALGAGIPVLTSADQLSTNNVSYNDSGESALANLVDGNTESVFHSTWTEAMNDANVTAESWESTLAGLGSGYAYEGVGYHNLQIALDKPYAKISFKYTGRNSSDWCDSPNDIVVFATNDANVAASANNNNEASWDEITELTEGFPAKAALAKYTSPIIDLGKAYQYIRLVIKNTNNFGKMDGRKFAKPEVTGVTWNLSEFMLYGTLADNETPYFNYTDVRVATDDLKPLLAAAKAKAARTTYQDEVDELQEAVDALIAALRNANVLDGVKPALNIEEAELVNVYTIDGKLVKKNVKATDAKAGLSRGLYIIGKQKVSIR